MQGPQAAKAADLRAIPFPWQNSPARIERKEQPRPRGQGGPILIKQLIRAPVLLMIPGPGAADPITHAVGAADLEQDQEGGGPPL